ncbi:MAG: hypothetical protein WDN48_03805 [Pseudolabrys sp.]
MSLLFSKSTLGPLTLQNHMVMCPLTRSRATGNVPNDLMAEYYGQRVLRRPDHHRRHVALAQRLGYPRIPGIFSQEQVKGWKKVTDAVHAGGAKIFVQLMHTGRDRASARICRRAAGFWRHRPSPRPGRCSPTPKA